MSTLAKFRKAVESHGASYTVSDTHDGKLFFVDAPEGKEWGCNGATVFCCHHVQGWPISEAYADMIERMSYGLRDHTPEEDE